MHTTCIPSAKPHFFGVKAPLLRLRVRRLALDRLRHLRQVHTDAQRDAATCNSNRPLLWLLLFVLCIACTLAGLGAEIGGPDWTRAGMLSCACVHCAHCRTRA
jgi:hypothetical protein